MSMLGPWKKRSKISPYKKKGEGATFSTDDAVHALTSLRTNGEAELRRILDRLNALKAALSKPNPSDDVRKEAVDVVFTFLYAFEQVEHSDHWMLLLSSDDSCLKRAILENVLILLKLLGKTIIGHVSSILHKMVDFRVASGRDHMCRALECLESHYSYYSRPFQNPGLHGVDILSIAVHQNSPKVLDVLLKPIVDSDELTGVLSDYGKFASDMGAWTVVRGILTCLKEVAKRSPLVDDVTLPACAGLVCHILVKFGLRRTEPDWWVFEDHEKPTPEHHVVLNALSLLKCFGYPAIYPVYDFLERIQDYRVENGFASRSGVWHCLTLYHLHHKDICRDEADLLLGDFYSHEHLQDLLVRRIVNANPGATPVEETCEAGKMRPGQFGVKIREGTVNHLSISGTGVQKWPIELSTLKFPGKITIHGTGLESLLLEVKCKDLEVTGNNALLECTFMPGLDVSHELRISHNENMRDMKGTLAYITCPQLNLDYNWLEDVPIILNTLTRATHVDLYMNCIESTSLKTEEAVNELQTKKVYVHLFR